jgi:hypothetical protein
MPLRYLWNRDRDTDPLPPFPFALQFRCAGRQPEPLRSKTGGMIDDGTLTTRRDIASGGV